MGITLDLAWIEPETTSKDDVEAAEITRQFYVSTAIYFQSLILKKVSYNHHHHNIV
jgi:hypothetical protein